MALVTELDLPVLDYTDPALRGERFHETLEELRARTWICSGRSSARPPRSFLRTVLNVLIGGVDTTQSQLSQGIRLFCEHPDQWELLRANPELVPNAVEEVLRHEPIIPFIARIVEEEFDYRDVTFPPDTVVMVCSWTANRDLEDPGGGDPGDFDRGIYGVDRLPIRWDPASATA